MDRRLTLVLVVVLIISVAPPVLGDSLWSSSESGLGDTGYVNDSGAGYNMDEAWRVDLNLTTNATYPEHYHLVAGEDTIYAGNSNSSDGSEIKAIDTATGDVEWTRQLDRPLRGQPTLIGEKLIFTDGQTNGTIAFHTSNGSTAWKSDIVTHELEPSEDGQLYAATYILNGTGTIVAGGIEEIDPATGESAWSQNVSSSYQLEVIDGTLVSVGSNHITFFDPDGTVVANVTSPNGTQFNSIVTSEDEVYASSWNTSYPYNRTNVIGYNSEGSQVMNISTQIYVTAARDGTLYGTNGSQNMTMIDTQTEEITSFHVPYTIDDMSLDNQGFVYWTSDSPGYTDQVNRIYAADPENESVVASRVVGWESQGETAIADGLTIALYDRAGKVAAYGEYDGPVAAATGEKSSLLGLGSTFGIPNVGFAGLVLVGLLGGGYYYTREENIEFI